MEMIEYTCVPSFTSICASLRSEEVIFKKIARGYFCWWLIHMPLQTWPWPSTPWERVHVDFLGPFLGKMIFVAVDAHSKWPKAQIMTTTTAAETIVVLRNVFARNGIPKQLVSDNGPQFRSEEFEQFMARNGVQHIRISPYHPASNGAAERFVQTIKHSLRALHQSGIPLQQALATFLLRYPTTPHSTTGVTPCTLFCKRQLRTKLDLLMPDVESEVQKQRKYYDRHCQYRELEVGQVVWARNLREGPTWRRGVICDRLGPRSYLVDIDHLQVGIINPGERGTERPEENAGPNSDGEFPSESETQDTGNTTTAGRRSGVQTEAPRIESGGDAGPLSTPQLLESTIGNDSSITETEEVAPSLNTPDPPTQQPQPRYPTRNRQQPNRLYASLEDC